MTMLSSQSDIFLYGRCLPDWSTSLAHSKCKQILDLPKTLVKKKHYSLFIAASLNMKKVL